ncbi:MAG: hypothetical protein ACKOA5_07400 [Actinomycetota bacterium]
MLMRTIERRVVRSGAIFLLCVIAIGCVADARRNQFDTRPLKERATSRESSMTLRRSWWQNAVEASPATEWWFQDERQFQGTTLVRGTLMNIVGGFGIDGSKDPQSTVEFNAESATTDVVVLGLKVSDGSTENGDLPDEVRIALPLPAPTDLKTLADELLAVEEFASILFPAVGLAGREGLFEVLDSHYLGAVDADGIVTFGSLLTGPDARGKVEMINFAQLKRGAGVVRLADLDGARARNQ